MKIIDFHENTKEANAVLAVAKTIAGQDFKNIKTFGFLYNDKPDSAKGHYVEILENGSVDLIDTKRGKYTLHHEDSPAIIVNTYNTDFWNMVFVVLHEICHSKGCKNENICNLYAKHKIENFLGDGFKFVVEEDNMNNFTKKIIKNIARFSNSQYYAKNLHWFKTASKENAEFLYFDGSKHPEFTVAGDFLDMRFFDLIGVRTEETAEWNFIPLPLLVDIVFGKNIPERTRIKKYINFISSCDFYTTREEWESEYTA